MNLVPHFCRRRSGAAWFLFSAALALLFLPMPGRALPTRLVVALDGIAYRDLVALQAGVMHTNFWGDKICRRAFTEQEGYFPASRMISTFPSASDVAWTDIFGDRPLPGYQRTYFSAGANSEISINGVTTTMEHERQMDWQLQNGFLRAMGYLFPAHTVALELHEMTKYFRRATGPQENFYVYLRASDDAQHLDRDVFALLCRLDRQLQKLRAEYRAREGRDLQIVILSDHGHNHAGRGRRVEVNSFLEKLGYRVSKTIATANDVVLPTVGVESWVEIHNAPTVTEKLAEQLCHLEGADVIAAPLTGQTNCFLVMNSRNKRAVIDWLPEKNSFRYTAEHGDPLNYQSVVETLKEKNQLDAAGFATADDWMAASMTHRYPLAPERIVRGLVHNTLNPATILVSLDNRFVHDSWLIQFGSSLVTCRSTHGGLDDLCSAGIVLSNFQPTRDTSTARVAAQFADFPGVKNFRELENGAEWIVKSEQAAVRIKRLAFDEDFARLPDNGIFLRAWSPLFTGLAGDVPLKTVIEKTSRNIVVPIGRSAPTPEPERKQIVFRAPAVPTVERDCERIYALPSNVVLEPRTEYKITGWISGRTESAPLFTFNFRTGKDGKPLAY
jgi:hypothetical protein